MIEAVAGRADFLVHLKAALQLGLVPVRKQAVTRQREVARLLVERVSGLRLIRQGRRDDRAQQRDDETQADERSEERRVGEEWVSTCRTRGSPDHVKKKKKKKT